MLMDDPLRSARKFVEVVRLVYAGRRLRNLSGEPAVAGEVRQRPDRRVTAVNSQLALLAPELGEVRTVLAAGLTCASACASSRWTVCQKRATASQSLKLR